MTTASCNHCDSLISVDVMRCPECGYSPVDDGKLARKLGMIIGILLTATLVGAPVGIPLIVLIWFVGRQKRTAGATGVRA